MKSRLFTFGLLTFSVLALGQNLDPKELEDLRENENISKEKVKVKRVYVFLVDKNNQIAKKGLLTSEISFNKYGKVKKTIKYAHPLTVMSTIEIEYDASGKKRKKIDLDPGGKVSQTIIYSYDSNGNVKTEYYDRWKQLISTAEQNRKLYGDYEFSYSPKREVISKTYSKYDSSGKTYTWRVLTPENAILYENKYWFNDKMQIKEYTEIDMIKKQKSKIIFGYDDKENRIEEFYYNGSESLVYKSINKYNERNLLIERFVSDSTNKPIQVVRFEYKF